MTTKDPLQSADTATGRAPLQGWKEIAAYLERDARTARRWEQSSGLPVRRHGGDRGSVYAYPAELDAWRAVRKPRAEMEVQPPSWRRMIPAAAGGAVLVAVAAVVLWGPIMQPPGPLVRASEASGVESVRQIWADAKTDTSGRVSADGRYLSFTDWDTGDLALRDLETGENRLLTDKGSWSDDGNYADWNVLSPAGEQVAYAWFNKDRGFYELRIIETAGGDTAAEPRVLYAHEDVPYLQPMDWFPSRHRILVLLARKDNFNQIVTVSVEDGSVTVIKSLDWRWTSKMRLSPDGRHIVYDLPAGDDNNSQRDIRLLATDGSSERTLVEHPGKDHVVGWTPDGGRVLFISDRTGGPGLWAITVKDGKPAGPPELLKSSFETDGPLGFGPRGNFFYSQSSGLMDIYVAEVDFETGKLKGKPSSPIESLVGRNRRPAWSPDGRLLAYVRGRGTIALRSIETREEREITSGFNYLRTIYWTPDGRGLVASGTDKRTRPGVFRVDVETGRVTPLVLTQPDWVYQAQLSPDGKLLHYKVSREDGPLALHRLRDLRTGEDRLIHQGDTNHASLSPDGQWIVLRDRDRKAKTAMLQVMPASGGEPQELLRVEESERVKEPEWIASPEWSPDGRHILFWRRTGDTKPYEMWRIRADGGEPQRTELSVGEFPTPFALHPDGKQIAYMQSDTQSEVWVMENFLPEMIAEK